VDEPDMKNVKRYAIGEDLTEDDNRKVIMVPGIHARVVEWFRRLNPHALPSIGFAPGVPESVGFAEAFEKAGIPAAHIDGERIWVRGVETASTPDNRAELLEMSRAGKVRVVWCRFVLREGIDMPWLCHGILATVFGSIQSYLQSGGRLLRSYPTLRQVTVQDHGGNWWRHGSLNADRRWKLTDTARSVAAEYLFAVSGDSETAPTEPEPFRCSNCTAILSLRTGIDRKTFTLRCPQCGHTMDFRRRSRPVIQADGELVLHEGAAVRPRVVDRKPDTQRKWEAVYWRCRKKGKTFTQAYGLFCHENGYYPPKTLPHMPRQQWQWHLPIHRVPMSDLFPKG
jgi:superfamily II DNA or RNA helicase